MFHPQANHIARSVSLDEKELSVSIFLAGGTGGYALGGLSGAVVLHYFGMEGLPYLVILGVIMSWFLFTAKKSRFLEMLAAIRNLKIPDFEMQLPSALRVNDLDDDVIDALVETGLRIATLAIESGDDYVQKHIIRKNVDLTKAVHAVRRLKDLGIVVRCYFILGFPGETKEQMRQTVDYARGLGADWCNFIIATPLIGSVMYDQFVEMGCIPEHFFLQANTIFFEREFDDFSLFVSINERIKKLPGKDHLVIADGDDALAFLEVQPSLGDEIGSVRRQRILDVQHDSLDLRQRPAP
jgi:hypothetical protein